MVWGILGVQLGHGALPIWPAWLTTGPESHTASLAPQAHAVSEILLQSLVIPFLSQSGFLSGGVLEPAGSTDTSTSTSLAILLPGSRALALCCSHPTHRTPVGVPATEVGRKPRKKHSYTSFFFFFGIAFPFSH